jgi:hypothetical protein
MRWGKAIRLNKNEPERWGWILSTVHPDDPECVGQGFEVFYRARDTR